MHGREAGAGRVEASDRVMVQLPVLRPEGEAGDVDGRGRLDVDDQAGLGRGLTDPQVLGEEDGDRADRHHERDTGHEIARLGAPHGLGDGSGEGAAPDAPGGPGVGVGPATVA